MLAVERSAQWIVNVEYEFPNGDGGKGQFGPFESRPMAEQCVVNAAKHGAIVKAVIESLAE